jgi:hypothetical protein
MKRGVAGFAVAVLLVGLPVAGALADHHEGGNDEPEVKSKITLSNTESGVYEGTVSSKRPACKKQRRVKVYHDQNENGVDRSDYRIGKDTTDKRGNYEVNGNQAPMGDDVVAVVAGRYLGDGTLCLDDDKTIAALSG